MSRTSASLVAIVAVVAAGAFADARADGEATLLSVPASSSLIARTTIDQVRGFPEMAATSAGRQAMQTSKRADVGGVDRLYRSAEPYAQTVAELDRGLGGQKTQTVARTQTASSTAWTVRKREGTIANVVVRNTTPVTFELEESTEETALPIMP